MTEYDRYTEWQQFKDDIHRPQYHFLPPANWMNDPNGFIHWQGQYHLFYQYNPDGAYHANMHWGHASSPDLIHWHDLPVALTPTPDGPDEFGCWSGCAVDHDGVPTIFYTSTTGDRASIQTQSMATSDDTLITWTKHPANPILSEVPAESGQTRDFRDPFVWREKDAWYMVVGSQVKDVGGVIFLYRSDDLINWKYLNPLYSSDNRQYGLIWECPNFFKLGDQWVLIISAHTGITVDTVYYFVGDFKNQRFTPHHVAVLDYGVLYAPLTTLDNQGRRVMMGWLRESRSVDEQRRSGWSGVQSIPRVLTLDDQHRLIMRPAPELEHARGQHHSFERMPVTQPQLLDVTGRALDIAVHFTVEPGGHCGFSLACSPDATERVDVIYHAQGGYLSVDTVHHEINGAQITHRRQVQHKIEAVEDLQIRILLDGSLIEIISNDRTSLATRVYPKRADADQVRILGAGASVSQLDIWEMSSIWQ